MIAHLVSSAGLVLDIIGALMLWRYGLPAAVDPKGRSFIVTSDVDNDEVKTARRYLWLSRVGVASLVLGFALQLCSNWIH